MDPRELKPGMLPPNLRGGAGVPLIGAPKQMQVMIAHLCVNCFPKVVPAPFLFGGHSYCQQCFVPIRKGIDRGNQNEAFKGVMIRNYKETWGETPEEEKQEKLDGNSK